MAFRTRGGGRRYGRGVGGLLRYGLHRLHDCGTAVPIPVLPGETLTQWSADGCCLFVRAPGDQAIKIFRINPATGRRELWKELALPDPIGNIGIAADQRAVVVTPDGKSFAYTYWSMRNELYLV